MPALGLRWQVQESKGVRGMRQYADRRGSETISGTGIVYVDQPGRTEERIFIDSSQTYSICSNRNLT